MGRPRSQAYCSHGHAHHRHESYWKRCTSADSGCHGRRDRDIAARLHVLHTDMAALTGMYRLRPIARTSHLHEFSLVTTVSRLITGCISGMLPVALALLP